MYDTTRRDVLKTAATLGLGATASALPDADVLAAAAPPEPQPQSAPEFFPGFKRGAYKSSAGVTIN